MSSSVSSVAVALLVALVAGPLLGRAASQWFSARGLSNALTGVRGAFLPYVLVLALVRFSGVSAWLAIGLVVGFNQSVSLSRWVTRHTGEWSRAVVGGIALGRSRAALLSEKTIARGAVVATLSTTTIQVIVLEAVLSGLALPGCTPEGSFGQELASGVRLSTLLFFFVGTALILSTELLCSVILQRGGGLRLPGRPLKGPHPSSEE